MNREYEKAEYEKSVFIKFLEQSKLEIDRNSIENGDPNRQEPDILCRYITGEEVGFELGRLKDAKLAAIVNRREPIYGEFTWTSDPSIKIAEKKLGKQYGVPFPVELLLYTEHPIITTDDVIIPTIKPSCQHHHYYTKVWFMGDTIEVLYG